MARRFVSTATAQFHPEATGGARDFILIFGDEVDTTGTEQNGRSQVVYRARTGWVLTSNLGADHPAELYFIDVGQGDAAFIVTPQGKTILVDGGRGDEAFQFLVWRYRLDLPAALPVDVDLLVLTHTDEDHLDGLAQIIAHPLIRVGRIVHSGIAKFRPGVFDTELGRTDGAGASQVLLTRYGAIQDLDRSQLTSTLQSWFDAVSGEPGLTCEAVDATSAPLSVGDPAVSLHVLGPRLVNHPQGPAYPWLDSSVAKTVNGHSVVLRLDIGAVRILLPGDLNESGARYLMQDVAFTTSLGAHVLKAPHHGSHDFHIPFLGAVRPLGRVLRRVAVLRPPARELHGRDGPHLALGRAAALLDRARRTVQPRPADDPRWEAPVDPSNAALLTNARQRFKKNLNGLINVERTAAASSRRDASTPPSSSKPTGCLRPRRSVRSATRGAPS